MRRSLCLPILAVALLASFAPPSHAQLGACCLDYGTCVQLSFWDCVKADKSYAWMPEPDCDPNPCPMCFCDACCLPDGTCMIADAWMCAEEGGEQFGHWVDCNPNPCDYPPGACCFETGQCVVLAAEDCAEGPGAYGWFEGESCDPDPCPTSSVPDGARTQGATWGKIRLICR